MRRYIKYIVISLIACSSLACSDLTEMNYNPTKSNGYIEPSLLVPTIQMSHSLGRQNASRFFSYPGGWVNHWSGVWAVVEYGGKAIQNNQYNYRLWQDLLYPEAVKNLVALENLVDDNPEMVNYSAIAKVLRVEVFLKLTDYYGDVPYFEGGQGYYQNIYAPKYDRQEDIYMDFFKKLDEAMLQFDPSKKSPETDCYFNGDVEKWKRFAASLKLRVAMRLIKVAPETAKTKASEAYNAGLMLSNEDIAYVKHQLDYETLGAGNAFSDIMLQMTTNPGLGISQFRVTTEFFNALSVRDNTVYDELPYHRLLSEDPRLRIIGASYFTTSGAGLVAMADAVETTELYRKYNAGLAGANVRDIVNNADGYLNFGGFMTVPAQEFMYGGGVIRKGENGYAGEEKARSVWAPAITPAAVNNAVWLTEKERETLYDMAVKYGGGGIPHGMYRLGPSRTILSVDSPYIHMSYAEVCFLLAETTARGWNIDSETAEDRFREGYIAAVKQFSLWDLKDGMKMPTDAAIENYVDTYLLPEIAKGGDDALEEINKQIWILHFLDPFEAWANIRRTDGMPHAYTKFYNRYPTENQSDGIAPKRIPYPIDEQTKNAANWQEAVDRMGGKDVWTTPVWWDVQE